MEGGPTGGCGGRAGRQESLASELLMGATCGTCVSGVCM